MKRAAKQIVVLAIPPIMELDLVGPVSVMQAANYYLSLKRAPPLYQIEVITSDRKKSIAGDCGLSIISHHRFQDLIKEPAKMRRIDTLLIVGGSGALKVKESDAVVKWLKKQGKNIRRIGSICTGAFVLAAAGLLNNRRATTHWQYCDLLARSYPLAKVEKDPIFLRDGNIYTSAGVTAGMDLLLDMVEEDLGAAIPLKIARGLVIFLRRPGGQNQFSVSLLATKPTQKSLRDLPAWIMEHIDEPLPIESLAHHAAMSLRQFARVFAREFGMTPARYVLEQRVEAARRALSSTTLGQKEICQRCGFGNTEHMRRAFLRIAGVTPSTYRNHFKESMQPLS